MAIPKTHLDQNTLNLLAKVLPEREGEVPFFTGASYKVDEKDDGAKTGKVAIILDDNESLDDGYLLLKGILNFDPLYEVKPEGVSFEVSCQKKLQNVAANECSPANRAYLTRLQTTLDKAALVSWFKGIPAIEKDRMEALKKRTPKIRIDQIKDYQSLSQAFQQVDTDESGRISTTESPSDVTCYDEDKSGTVEIWEYMTAANRLKGPASSLFAKSLVEQLKAAYHLASETKKDTFQRWSAVQAITALLENRFPKEQIVQFLATIAEKVQRVKRRALGFRAQEIQSDIDRTYENLPPAVEMLAKEGCTIGQIMNFLTTIAEKVHANAGYVYGEIPRVVEGLRKLGLTIEKTLNLLVEIATRVWWAQVNQAYSALPHAFGALQRLGLEERESISFLFNVADKATSWTSEAYYALRQAIEGLEKKGLEPQEIVQFLSWFPKNFEGAKIGRAFGNLPSLLEHGLSPAQARKLIKLTQGLAQEELPKVVAALRKNNFDVKEILKFFTRISLNAGEEAPRALLLLSSMSSYATPENFPQFTRGFYFLLHTAKEELLALYRICEGAGFDPTKIACLDPTKIKDRESLGWEIAATINRFYEPKRELSEQRHISQGIAVLINRLHDQDRSDDLTRKTIVQNLSARSLYLLTALGGPDLYTSTFLLLYDRMTGDPLFVEKLKALDPQGAYLLDFILTVAGFNRLLELFRRDSDYFGQRILDTVSEADQQRLFRNVSLLINPIGDFLKSKDLIKFKNLLESHLLASYQKAREGKDPVRKGIFGYMIKLYQDSFGNPHARSISQELPPIVSPPVPKRWLDDKVLRAKLFFYEDEKPHFQLIQRMYKAKGFRVSGTEKTARMTKSVKGIALEVIATLEREEIAKSIGDPSIDIVAHRGHSFHLQETFPACQDCGEKEKLLYLGSCGSFRTVPELIQSYHGNFFLSDEDTGRGEDNNHILYYLMEAIAKGERDWDKIRKYISDRHGIENRGIIFPTDRSLLLFNFVQAVIRGG